jgi:hypothetical protein
MALEEKVTFRGKTLNQRTVEMLEEAERNLGFNLRVTKGCYLPEDPKSARTHCGGGAADLSVKKLKAGQKKQAVLQLRRVGFAAWHRTQAIFVEHIHVIAAGDRDLDPQAQEQVDSYRKRGNGLHGKSKAPDDGPGGYRLMTFEKYKAMRKEAEKHPPVEPKDVTISVTSVRMAAEGQPITDTRKFDAEQFMAFAHAGIKVIPAPTFMAWRNTRDKKFFEYAVKCVQAKFGLRQDGDPGPITMGKLEAFGYTIAP